MLPVTVASTSARRRPMSHWGTTTCAWPGAARTAAGAGPSHLVRRSRQRTDVPPPVRRQEGGGSALAAVGGRVVVVAVVVAVTLFNATDGERLFSKTPEGPTRMYGSPW